MKKKRQILPIFPFEWDFATKRFIVLVEKKESKAPKDDIVKIGTAIKR